MHGDNARFTSGRSANKYKAFAKARVFRSFARDDKEGAIPGTPDFDCCTHAFESFAAFTPMPFDGFLIYCFAFIPICFRATRARGAFRRDDSWFPREKIALTDI